MKPLQLSTDNTRMLSDLLQAELQQIRLLQQLLEQEYQALSSIEDPARIEQISQEKLALIRRIEGLFGKRKHFLEKLGLQQTGDLESLISKLPADSEATARFTELKEAADQAHRQNMINGGIVTTGQRHVRQTLDILHGKTESLQTYGPAGEARSEDRASFSSKV